MPRKYKSWDIICVLSTNNRTKLEDILFEVLWYNGIYIIAKVISKPSKLLETYFNSAWEEDKKLYPEATHFFNSMDKQIEYIWRKKT